MKLNLRKARKLESKVANHLNSQNIQTNVRVLANESVESVQKKVDEAQAKVLQSVETNRKLTQVRYVLRNRIDETNQKVGINSLMNQREQVQHELKVVNGVSKEARFSMDEVVLTMTSKKAALDKGERHIDVNVNVDVVSEKLAAAVKEQTKNLRNQLEDIEEQLTQKNAGAEVTLTPEEVELLKVSDLL